jgi:hypothetical protein
MLSMENGTAERAGVDSHIDAEQLPGGADRTDADAERDDIRRGQR